MAIYHFLSSKSWIHCHNQHKIKQIYNFINKPIPLCRWCKTKRPIIRWQRTKLTSIEWTGGEVNDSRYIFEINKYRTISTFHTLQRELVMLNRRKK